MILLVFNTDATVCKCLFTVVAEQGGDRFNYSTHCPESESSGSEPRGQTSFKGSQDKF